MLRVYGVLMVGSKTKWADWWAEWNPIDYVIAAIALGLAVFNLLRLSVSFPDQWDTSIPEVAIVYSILGVANSDHALYRDFSQFPFTTTPYGPLYYLLCGYIVKFAGGGVAAAYIIGRTVSLLAFAGCIKLVHTLILRIGGTQRSACIVALLLCGLSIVFPWAVSTRPDFSALVFSLLGIVSLRVDLGSRLRLSTLIFWAVAFFIKPSFIAAPLSWGCYLLSQRDWKSAFKWMFCLGAILAAGLALTQKLSGGWYIANTMMANLAPPSWNGAAHMIITNVLPGSLLLLLLGIGGAVIDTKRHNPERNPADSEKFFLICTAFCSTLLFFLLSLKAGADKNYFLEPLFLWAIPSALCLDFLHTLAARSANKTIFVAIPVVVAAGVAFDSMAKDWEQVFFPYGQLMLKELIKNKKGDIFFLSNGEGLRYNRGLTLYDGYNASYLETQGQINLSDFAKRLERCEFSAVVDLSYKNYYGYSLVPPSMLEPLTRNYERVATYGIYQWLLPRKHPLPMHVPEFPMVRGEFTQVFHAQEYSRRQIEYFEKANEGLLMATNGYIERYMEIPHDGTYQIDLYARSSEYFGTWAEARVSIGDEYNKIFKVDQLLMSRFSVRTRLKKGNYPVRIAFINDVYEPPHDLDLVVDRLEITSVAY